MCAFHCFRERPIDRPHSLIAFLALFHTWLPGVRNTTYCVPSTKVYIKNPMLYIVFSEANFFERYMLPRYLITYLHKVLRYIGTTV